MERPCCALRETVLSSIERKFFSSVARNACWALFQNSILPTARAIFVALSCNESLRISLRNVCRTMEISVPVYVDYCVFTIDLPRPSAFDRYHWRLWSGPQGLSLARTCRKEDEIANTIGSSHGGRVREISNEFCRAIYTLPQLSIEQLRADCRCRLIINDNGLTNRGSIDSNRIPRKGWPVSLI